MKNCLTRPPVEYDRKKKTNTKLPRDKERRIIALPRLLEGGAHKEYPLGGHREYPLESQREYSLGGQREYPLRGHLRE